MATVDFEVRVSSEHERLRQNLSEPDYACVRHTHRHVSEFLEKIKDGAGLAGKRGNDL